MLAQLATFHAPDDLRIAVYAAPTGCAIGTGSSGCRTRSTRRSRTRPAGPAGLRQLADLERLLGGKALEERGRFEPGAIAPRQRAVPRHRARRRAAAGQSAGWPAPATATSSPSMSMAACPGTARRPHCGCASTPDTMEKVSMTRAARRSVPRSAGRPAEPAPGPGHWPALIAPYRLGAASAISDALSADGDLAALLGVPDLRTMDPDASGRPRTRLGTACAYPSASTSAGSPSSWTSRSPRRAAWARTGSSSAPPARARAS